MWEKLNELVDNKNLIKHCLAVEAVMLRYADYFDIPKKSREKWAVAGLIHDADWEKYPEEHPQIIVNWLTEQGAGKEVVNSVASHGFEFSTEPESLMAKTLRAVDELTGLIVAVTLVRPSKKLTDVSVESIQKKWDVTSFARGVKREDIEKGAKEIGVPLEEHIGIALTAMKETSDKLGL